MIERTDIDVIIVGQGIAGSSLAWALMDRGMRPLVIDDRRETSASSVAAGLITPVTGAKLKPQPDFSFLAGAAAAHYRAVEAATKVDCYFARPAWRLLSTERELSIWNDADPALRAELEPTDDLPAGIAPGQVNTLMPNAARLDTQRYLEAVHTALCDKGLMLGGHVEPEDVTRVDAGIALPDLSVRARHIVFCRGYADARNSYFAGPSWRPAKGQVLTIRCADLDIANTVHAPGLWLTPLGGTLYLAGASYEWDTLDDRPTAEAREALCEKLDRLLTVEYTVVDHRAAVRPIVQGRKPVCGPSPKDSRIWLFNGLSSKGALYAPTVAMQVAGALCKDIPVDDQFRFDLRASGEWQDD